MVERGSVGTKRLRTAALNKARLDEKHPEELNDITGHQQVYLDRTCNGGGVSIYISDSIKFRTSSDVPKNDLELICIEIEPPKSKLFLVLAWYKPSRAPVDAFVKLEKVIYLSDKGGKEIILLGDTSCDLATLSMSYSIFNNILKNRRRLPFRTTCHRNIVNLVV